jgi:hypothetical protein
MATIIKSEWHQVETRQILELDVDILSQIYPDNSTEEIEELLSRIENGEIDIEIVLQEADFEGVDLDWEPTDYEDWWSLRKGGYEVTYEVEGVE